MLIHGLQKLTLLDFPGHTACTVFTGSCNWRCPFCHNALLVLDPNSQPAIPEEEFFSFLKKRSGLLDGVAVTGGEPTLQADLPAFLRRVKELGFAVKLDTNGTNPAMLREILSEGLADYVAMDIKAAPENYARLTGTVHCQLDAVKESVELLRGGATPFEFRTTLVKPLHTEEDFAAIGPWLAGPEPYFLQVFKDSGELIGHGLEGFRRAEAERFLEIVRPYLPAAELRGYD